MKLYREHYQPQRVALQSEGGLNAVATRSEDGHTLVLKVVNASAAVSDCLIRVDGVEVREATQWVVAAELRERNTILHPHRIAPVESPVAGASTEFVHTFPAHSVTVMELHVAGGS
jgi:alpha-L-arabinofuranosidase